MKIVWYGKAERDLDEATSYIDARNPQAANKVEDRIHAAIERLCNFPQSGRPGRRPGTREVVIVDYPYVVRYRVRGGQIEILRVFHTSMQWVLR